MAVRAGQPARRSPVHPGPGPHVPGRLLRLHCCPGGVRSQIPPNKVVQTSHSQPAAPAVHAILPMLAADQGRARARTLLFIAGVGPDAVDLTIAGLDAALGTSSPGPAGLGDLVAKARAAMSASSPKVARQHVISRAILRRFCEPGPGNAGLQLMRHDLLNGTARPNGPGGVGYVRNFVKIDSQRARNCGS
jgi:hypothetical protein